MTSRPPGEAFVWIFLPGRTEPVVAGRLFADGGRYAFNYGRSYLARGDAIPIYEPELPLRPGAQPPPAGLAMASSIRDAAPDAWGRRVILNRLLGKGGRRADVDRLDELTYLLQSGSDRIGALDFQESPDAYRPREAQPANLEELMSAADLMDRGAPVPPGLEQALFHGSSIGGARPKALIDDGELRLIAKFSSTTDVVSVVKGEFAAMRLADLVGLNVAPVRLAQAAGKDVLLIERFDRVRQAGGWSRRAMVSALTLLGLDEMAARYASYEDLAAIIRERFVAPAATLKELYGRLVFNVLSGNTDDHARNHAAFWDGRRLELTPAYDICPQARAGNEATQAMLIAGHDRMSRLATCLQAAPSFLLDAADAEGLIARQVETIRANWPLVCEEAGFSDVDRRLFWRRQFLNPFAFEGAPPRLAALAGD